MATKATLKRYSGLQFVEFYPKTTHDQIIASGTPSNTTFLRGDGVWATPAVSGTGDVTGPASSVDNRIAVFNGTTGKIIKDSGTLISELALASHTHDDRYYTETEIDAKIDFAIRLQLYPQTKNTSGTTIPKGAVVQFAGTQGDFSLIKQAVASEINANPSLLMGLAREAILNNAFGDVVWFGNVLEIATGSLTIGQILWFDTVNGGLTATEPATNKIQIAAVQKASSTPSATNGILLVRIKYVSRDIDEVDGLQTALNGKLNTSGGTMTGLITFNTTSTNNGFFWDVNSDQAGINFKNTGDGDTNSYLNFFTKDNGNEYIKFSHQHYLNGNKDWMDIKDGAVRINGMIYVNATQSGNITLGTNTLTNGTAVIIEGDARLSDARTPLAHTHTIANITNLQTSLDAKLNTSGGTITGNVAVNSGVTIDGVDISAFKASYDAQIVGVNRLIGILDVTTSNNAGYNYISTQTLPGNSQINIGQTIYRVADNTLYKATRNLYFASAQLIESYLNGSWENPTYVDISDTYTVRISTLTNSISMLPGSPRTFYLGEYITFTNVEVLIQRHDTIIYQYTQNGSTWTTLSDVYGNGDWAIISALSGNTITQYTKLEFSSVKSVDGLIGDIDLTSKYLQIALKGANNGLAELNSSGKVPTAQLPTILVLGETSADAYRGDRGKTAYDHSQITNGTNPHNTTFDNIASKPTTLSGYGITDAYSSSNPSGFQTAAQVATAVSGLVDSAPTTLDTLNELAAALGDDPNFATTVSTSIGTKVTANTAITAGTATKITYDTKGLVTSGTTLAAGDIPNLTTAKITSGTFADARIPNLNASKITAGTFGVVRGGTGATTLASGEVLIGAGTGAVTTLSRSGIDSRASFPPSAHTHTIANVTGLQDALNAKVSKAGDTMTGQLLLVNTNASIDTLKLQFDAGGGGNWGINPFIVGISNGGLSFVDRLNSTTPFVISNSGNVGIGTTNPSSAIHIKKATPEIKLEAGSTTDSGTMRYNTTTKSIEFIFV
jgi:hypothetical protein